ncbi:MAG: hypothetical protein ACK4K9_11500 [Bacteroidia bacterium]
MKKIDVFVEDDNTLHLNKKHSYNAYNHNENGTIQYFFSIGYIFVIFILIILIVLEIKMNYSTDFFDNLGTPFDEAYRSMMK